MAKAIDLTGQRFGKLTVLKRDYEHQKGRTAYWLCQCDCGKQKVIDGANLRRGQTKSCGCINIERCKQMGNNHILDLTGQRFGKLVCLSRTDVKKRTSYIWKCQCDCGNITYVEASCLTKGDTQSCGCIKSQGELKIIQLLNENNIPFEKEKQFDNCRFPDTNKMARFDFYVDNKYIIEFDGKQHFEINNFFEQSLEDIQKHDEFKNNWCKDNNIPIIRIPYYKLEDLKIEDIIL